MSDQTNSRPEWPGPMTEKWNEIMDEMRSIEKQDQSLFYDYDALRREARSLMSFYGYRDDRQERIRDNREWRDRHLDAMGISYGNGVLDIRVPDILPHRRSSPNTMFYADFEGLLCAFKAENPDVVAMLQKELEHGAVLVIQHSYHTRSMIRDNDNVELKALIDCLWKHGFMENDTGDYLTMVLTARLSEDEKADETHLCLMSKKRFKDAVAGQI